jgi:hypothetical protein
MQLYRYNYIIKMDPANIDHNEVVEHRIIQLINQLTNDDKYSNIFALMVRAHMKIYQIMDYPGGDNIVRRRYRNFTRNFTVEEWALRGVACNLVMLDQETSAVIIHNHQVVIDDNEVIREADAKIRSLEDDIRNENSPPRQIIRTGTHTTRAVTPPRLREVREIIHDLNAEIRHFNNNHINNRPRQQGGRKNKTIRKNNKKAKKTRNNRK